MVSLENSCYTFVIITRIIIQHLFCQQSNNNMFTMDDNDTHHDDIHAGYWDDETDMMAAAALVVVNANSAIMNCIVLAYAEQQEQERLQLRNDILTPNQAYRHQPRQPKAIFRHHEALWCIQRDYLGIPGDSMTPVLRDKNFKMMFRLPRTQV